MVLPAWGEPSSLEYQELADPVAGPGEVLIEVQAMGCNFPDILMCQGKYQIRPPLPFIPGYEVAGSVLAVGHGVTRVAPDQRVMALLRWGGYAEMVATDERDVFVMPEEMTFDTGAAFGVAYQTAYCALTHRAALRPGEWLLVHGAAGGVGLAAVQVGRALGARVIATAGSPAKLDIARQSGAEVLVDYTREDWVERVKAVTEGQGANVIYDPVGGEVFDLSTKCIAFEGRLLPIGFAGGRIPTLAVNRPLIKNFSVVGVHWGLYHYGRSPLVDRWMADLWALWNRGAVDPVIYRVWGLSEAARALAALASRQAHGKVVLLR